MNYHEIVFMSNNYTNNISQMMFLRIYHIFYDSPGSNESDHPSCTKIAKMKSRKMFFIMTDHRPIKPAPLFDL